MSTWLVSSAAQRIELDAQGRSEVSFTVTNSGPAPEQAMFDVAPGPGTDRSWFQVIGEPRLLTPQGAAEFKIQSSVPPGTVSGLYSLQGVAFTAGRPQETAALSDPVTFEVRPMAGAVSPVATAVMPAAGERRPMAGAQPMAGEVGQPEASPGKPTAAPTAAKPKPKRRARLLVAAALALVVIVALAAAGFFFLRGNDDGQADAAPPPPPPAEVVVPDVTLIPEAQATAILQVSNLSVGRVVTVQQRNRKDGTVVQQSLRQGTTVDAGASVDLAVVRNS